MKPNIFAYATKELSQDAFICWLAEWAHPECKREDTAMHELGMTFIQSLCQKAGKDCPAVSTVKIYRQKHHLDILIAVNGTQFGILVEDKVGSKQHSNQLQRYMDAVKKDKTLPNPDVCIFVKTHDEANYDQVKKSGFHPFLRQDFIALLRGAPRNLILSDFLAHLKAKEDAVESFRESEIPWGNGQARVGFFKAIQQDLKGKWGYVNNRSGGFMGFDWGKRCVQVDSRQFQIYLQLENDTLCIKAGAWAWSAQQAGLQTGLPSANRVRSLIGKMGGDFSKPTRLALSRQTATLAVWKSRADYRIQTQSRKLNQDATVAFLKDVEKRLDDALRELGWILKAPS